MVRILQQGWVWPWGVAVGCGWVRHRPLLLPTSTLFRRPVCILLLLLVIVSCLKLKKSCWLLESPYRPLQFKMADFSESTPFLADNDHSDNYDETEHHIAITAPARSHFKLPLKVLTILVSLLCISIFSLLIASYIFINGGPFERTERSQDAIRDLAICVCILLIVSISALV